MNYMPDTVRAAQDPVQGARQAMSPLAAMQGAAAPPGEGALGSGVRGMQWTPNMPDPLMNPAIISQMMQGLKDPDVKWYAYMAGAMGPTKSGSYGESLSNALSAYANTRMEEMKLQAHYMPMLAQQLIASQQARYAHMAKQQELNQQWNGMIVGRLTALLQGSDPDKGIDPNVARAQVGDLMRKQLVPADLASVYITGIPDDPKAAWQYVNRLALGRLDPQQAYETVVPKASMEGAGGRTVAVTPGRPGAGQAPVVAGVMPHVPNPQPPGVVPTDQGLFTVSPDTGGAAPAGTSAAAAVAAGAQRTGTPPMILPRQPGSSPAGASPVPSAGGIPGMNPAATPSVAPVQQSPGAVPSPAAGAAGPSSSGMVGMWPYPAPPDTPETPRAIVRNARGEERGVTAGTVPRFDPAQFSAGMAPGKFNPIAKERYESAQKDFQKTTADLANKVNSQQEQLLRMQQVAQLARQVQTGASAEVRRMAGSWAKDLAVLSGMSDKAADNFASRVAGGSVAALQEFQKMAISGALSAFAAERTPGTRMTQAEYQQILNAVQSPQLDAAALEGLRSKMVQYSRREDANLALRTLFLQTPGADFGSYDNYWHNFAAKNLGFVPDGPRSDAVQTKDGRWAVPVIGADGKHMMQNGKPAWRYLPQGEAK